MVRINGNKIVIEIERDSPGHILWLIKTSLLEVLGEAASTGDDLGNKKYCFAVVTDFLQELELGEEEYHKLFGEDEK
ncbi:MAG: hypothetical protein HQ521_05985 [Bacteroidetes bacterium]|nr:hypothetical protein [Bacteroidota bacterium]